MTSLQYREIRYGTESELQIVGLWEFPEAERVAAASADRLYFVFIHGGAWRDPHALTDTAIPTIDRLLDGAAAPAAAYLARNRLAGFASIGYRLSPHPDFPQDPATTPPAQLRIARHPDHLRDVWAGLAALAADGRAGGQPSGAAAIRPGTPGDYLAHGRYLVYGHSCGAFLAFQLWMGRAATAGAASSGVLPPLPAPLPRLILGLEGIYDLRGLVDRGGPPASGGGPGTAFQAALREIAEGAFGTDRAVWDAASPGQFDWTKALPSAAEGSAAQPGRRLAVLAYSREDELVDEGEIDTMEQALKRGSSSSSSSSSTDDGIICLVFRDLRGQHDEIREDGREVARMLTESVRHLDQL